MIPPGLFDLIDALFTSEEERTNGRLKLLELQQAGTLKQLEINKTEATHASIFVAGWRPFIGWTCGAAFCWTFLLFPMAQACLVYFGQDISDLPNPDLSDMMPVLLGMLGLGAMRSYEKSVGVARSDMIDRRDK